MDTGQTFIFILRFAWPTSARHGIEFQPVRSRSTAIFIRLTGLSPCEIAFCIFRVPGDRKKNKTNGVLLPASGWREAPCRSGNPPSLDGASFTRTTRPTLASNVGCSSFRWASPQRSCSRACVRRRHGKHSSRRSMVGGRRRFAS